MAKRGIIIEFDYTAIDGGLLQYETTKGLLEKIDSIPLDPPTEARYLVSTGDLQAGLTQYFATVKTKKTALKASKDVNTLFQKALVAKINPLVGVAFTNFVNAIAEKDLKVVILTRANVEAVKEAFAPVLKENVVLQHLEMPVYGQMKWDDWRRVCAAASVDYRKTVIIAGTGSSVKSALQAGIGSCAVIHEHLRYQDFTGASVIFNELSVKSAKKFMETFRI